MIQKIAHIAVAVADLDAEIIRFRDILGLTYLGQEAVLQQKVKVAFFQCGDVHIELLAPLSPDSPISGFLEKKGGGLHHISFQVDDIRSEMASLKEKGVRLLDAEPREGAHHSQTAFLHPKSIANLLIELQENPPHHS